MDAHDASTSGYLVGDRSRGEDLSDFGTNEPLVTEESRREYIKQLVAIIGDDMKNVMVMATISTLVASYIAHDLLEAVQRYQLWVRASALAAIVLLLIGAGLLFAYSARMHRVRMDIVRCIVSANARGARNMWATSGANHFRGTILLRSGLLVIVLGGMMALLVAGKVYL